MSELSAEQKRRVERIERVYYGVQALLWLSVSLPAALAVLLLQARGLNLFEIGLALSVFSVVVALLEVPSGVWADAVGRKRVTLLGYAFLLADSLVFLFVFSFPALVIASVLNGVGRALASGALEAWFIDRLKAVQPDLDLQPPLARAGTVELLALTAGTLLGGYLPTLFGYLPEDGTVVLTPLAVSVVGSILVKVLLLAFVALFVEERAVFRAQDGVQSEARGVRRLALTFQGAVRATRQNRTLLLLLSATLASGFSTAGLETFWGPRFATLLGGDENTLAFGVIMAGSFLVGALGNAVSVSLSQLFRKRYGLVAATFQGLQGAAFVMLALQTAALPAAALFWLVYLSRAVKTSPSMALYNEEVAGAQRAAMLSVSSLAVYVGYFVGSVVLGYVAERAGVPAAWLVAGGVTVMSLVLYVRVDARTSQPASQPR